MTSISLFLNFYLSSLPNMFAFSLQTTAARLLQLLEWELAGATLRTISTLLHGGEGDELAKTGSSGALLGGGSVGPQHSLLPPLASRLTEKGVLQLMFDIRMLRDVLAGGRPPSATGTPPAAAAAAMALGEVPQDPSVAAALAERKREWLWLEQMLQVSMIFYEFLLPLLVEM